MTYTLRYSGGPLDKHTEVKDKKIGGYVRFRNEDGTVLAEYYRIADSESSGLYECK